MADASELIHLPATLNASITIGLITDTHYWPGGGSYYGSDGSLQLLGWSDQLLDSVIDELTNTPVDLTLHLGDVTCGGGVYPISAETFADVQKSAFGRLQTLTAPIHALAGNHDCPPDGGPWTDFEQLWGLKPGMGKTIETPHARLVLLNAQGHSPEQMDAARPGDPIYGWVSDDELARLDQTLATADDRPVILFVHQLLKPWSGDREFVAYYPVQNRDAVLQIMAAHGNVKAVFQGHAHRFDVQMALVGGKPCWFVVSPSIIQYPVAWLELTLAAQTLRVELRSLPLPGLIEQSRISGDGQTWRAGEPHWHDFIIPLGELDERA